MSRPDRLSVSALMASPLSKDLIAGAIGESGALIAPTLAPVPLADGEARRREVRRERRRDVARSAARDAGRAAARSGRASPAAAVPRRPSTAISCPKAPVEIFAAGEQAHVPLLVGWNSEENRTRGRPGPNEPTPENFAKAVRSALRGPRGRRAEAVCAAIDTEEVMQAATDLASDRFIAYSTWKWFDLHAQDRRQAACIATSMRVRGRRWSRRWGTPCRASPAGSSKAPTDAATSRPRRGAVHSAEIEYAMGNLARTRCTPGRRTTTRCRR